MNLSGGFTEAECVERAELMARLNSRDVDYSVAVITGTRGGEHGVHVIFDEVRPGETLHSIWQQGECLLRRSKA